MKPADTCMSLTIPGVTHVRSGKVREVFDTGDALLVVATDRISAFDCIMPNGIPGKGKILTQLSAWWFDRFSSAIHHHVITTDAGAFPSSLADCRDRLEGRSMLVRRARVIPVECVARGYLIGSGWKDYQATGRVCGIPLREGYRLADKLDAPLFTPAAKADEGHDENISFDEVVRVCGRETAQRLRELTLKLYREAAEYAETRGIILADTKFEFGIDEEGNLMLIDEILTPDSSRYWPRDSYQPGTSPPSFDKQFVRDYLERLSWNKTPPAPELPPEIVDRTREKYIEVFQRITGQEPVL